MAKAMPQGHRGTARFSGPSGNHLLRRRRPGDVAGRPTLVAPAQAAGKIIVFNNSALSFVELEMKAAGILEEGTELVSPDFVALAQSAGVFGERVEDPADLKEAVHGRLPA